MRIKHQELEELMTSGEYDLTAMEQRKVTKVWKLQALPPNLNIEPLRSTNIDFNIVTYNILNPTRLIGHLEFQRIFELHSSMSIISLCFNSNLPKNHLFYITYSFFDSTNNLIVKRYAEFSTNTINTRRLDYYIFLSSYLNITIVCQITYGCFKTKNCFNIKPEIFKSNNYECKESHKVLSNAMKLLINDCGLESPDLSIWSKDLSATRVHSSILYAAISSHQSKMHVLNNNNKGLILNNDVAAIREMVRFLYIGKIENIKEVACDLLDIAHQLNLTGLKDVCLLYFDKYISIENVVDIFTVADKWTIDLLKTKTLQFMKKHYIKICVTEKFKNLKLSMPNLEMNILSVV